MRRAGSSQSGIDRGWSKQCGLRAPASATQPQWSSSARWVVLPLASAARPEGREPSLGLLVDEVVFIRAVGGRRGRGRLQDEAEDVVGQLADRVVVTTTGQDSSWCRDGRVSVVHVWPAGQSRRTYRDMEG